jgi:predicted  nucleic acid-binding Zn-ribbon protein
MSTDQTPLAERIEALRGRYRALQDKVSMADVTGKLGDVATEIVGLPEEIARLRERGYAFAGYLERKAEVLREQWEAVRQQVQAIIGDEIARIQKQFDELGEMWQRLETQKKAKSQEQSYNLLRVSIENVEGAVDAARARIEGLYGEVPGNVSQTQGQIRQITHWLDRADEATVAWGPTEALVMAMEGEWVQTGKGRKDPDGMLYLTDQRLIFEQKEKVGGRLGFGGEQVQEVLFETPIGAISEVRPEDKGLFGRTDLVHLTLSSGDYAEVTFEVKEGGVDSDWYAAQLNRVISGEIEKERAFPVDEEVTEAVRDAPTACTTCGATLPAITRGMTEITCQYCGTVVRI